MCGSLPGGASGAVAGRTVITGTVTRGGEPVGQAYVRLLDATGEFTAEAPTSATGAFTFFAAPGPWTLRTLAPGGVSLDTAVTAVEAQSVEAKVELPA